MPVYRIGKASFLKRSSAGMRYQVNMTMGVARILVRGEYFLGSASRRVRALENFRKYHFPTTIFSVSRADFPLPPGYAFEYDSFTGCHRPTVHVSLAHLTPRVHVQFQPAKGSTATRQYARSPRTVSPLCRSSSPQ